MIRSIFHTIIVLFLSINGLFSQSVQTLNSAGNQSLRGLSVVDDKVVWVSGTKVGRSLDAGKTWEWMEVQGYQKTEFRDIEAFSKDVAIIMSVGEPAYILKTIDGGKNWKLVYENKTKGMFLDAMDFVNEKIGIVVGDPIDGNFFLAKTLDGGESWEEVFPLEFKADSTEACFASSGTNIRMYGVYPQIYFVFVSGGVYSNFNKGKILFHDREDESLASLILQNKKEKLAILQGTSSTGANSIAIKDYQNFIVVGGDFTNTEAGPNCVITSNRGESWSLPAKAPEGYKSCVEYLYEDTWICCGLTGVDISKDNGKTWKQISTDSYHTCRKAKNSNTVFLSGNGSRVGVLVGD